MFAIYYIITITSHKQELVSGALNDIQGHANDSKMSVLNICLCPYLVHILCPKKEHFHVNTQRERKR